ncbi:hypothetical protein AXG93_4620s1700 [Marchantia polymorpha subsp. ruderalis]|uniref:Uncharacterized protein n=1 Tax=Marchantia polymorpha subsp. ruderalis TaxID=1480154 RepID=A0A176VYS3_MARPO|nr:hypothetical protein AXG93_4620s1700 [Marchantia polymorpha subsp. ruderalis]
MDRRVADSNALSTSDSCSQVDGEEWFPEMTLLAAERKEFQRTKELTDRDDASSTSRLSGHGMFGVLGYEVSAAAGTYLSTTATLHQHPSSIRGKQESFGASVSPIPTHTMQEEVDCALVSIHHQIGVMQPGQQPNRARVFVTGVMIVLRISSHDVDEVPERRDVNPSVDCKRPRQTCAMLLFVEFVMRISWLSSPLSSGEIVTDSHLRNGNFFSGCYLPSASPTALWNGHPRDDVLQRRRLGGK